MKDLLTNEDHIKNGKEQLNKVLSKYPKGFWEELLQDKDDNRHSLIFCLVGKLHSNSNGYSPTAFASYYGDAYYVFVNSSYV